MQAEMRSPKDVGMIGGREERVFAGRAKAIGQRATCDWPDGSRSIAGEIAGLGNGFSSYR